MHPRIWLVYLSGVTLICTASAPASNVNEENRHAYGANVGWVDFRAGGADGAVLGLHFARGHVYSPNCGWISLGHGPTNGWSYSNASDDDWGVNHDGVGGLSGLAYGANIGWISFATNGSPRIDLATGALDGYAYGPNVGWISLSNATSFVQVDYLDWGPDTDSDGIPDAWEKKQAGNLSVLAAPPGDADENGIFDIDEFFADTNPLEADESLRIVEVLRTGGASGITWSALPTRRYWVERAFSAGLGETGWQDSGLGPLLPAEAGSMTRVFTLPGTYGAFRIRVGVPLSPPAP